jgi:hypothetical protein
MSEFLTNLWTSIFTPGPTPTLLLATNASFAALQLLFLALLVATYSVHFVILSCLCGGLWWAINWFAGEIAAAQRVEEEAKRVREVRAREKREREGGEQDREGMDTGDDTEGGELTEVEDKGGKPSATTAKSSSAGKTAADEKKQAKAPRPETQSTVFVEHPLALSADIRDSTPVPSSAVSGKGTGAAMREYEDAARKRRGAAGLGESTGELSTDSEWEKVSQSSEER